MVVAFQGVAPGGAAFQPLVDQNASLSGAIRFLSRVRRLDTTTHFNQGLAHLLGRRARQAGLAKAQLTSAVSALSLRAPDLRSLIVDEALWYTRVGVNQLRHAAFTAGSGYPTLGRTSAYYANFYFAHALCRLAGRVPLYLRDYEPTGRPGPTVVLAWDGSLPAHSYFVTGYVVGRRASHAALWNLYFQIFRSSPDAVPDFLPIVVPAVSEEEETIDRNEHTYVPWFSFTETQSAGGLQAGIIGAALTSARVKDALSPLDPRALLPLATDPDLSPYAKACLRALFVRRFLTTLAKRSKAFATLWGGSASQLIAQLAFLTQDSHDAFTRLLGSELAS
jgi:hypothetical protein